MNTQTPAMTRDELNEWVAIIRAHIAETGDDAANAIHGCDRDFSPAEIQEIYQELEAK